MTLDQKYNLALEHYNRGQFESAKITCGEMLADYPNHPAIMHLMAVLQRIGGLNEIALQLLRRALLINPHHPEYHNDLGISLLQAGELAPAIDAFHEAIRLDPQFAEANLNLGAALSRAEQIDQAIAAFRTAVQLRPSLTLAHVQLGNLLSASGQLEQGLKSYQFALRLTPNDADLLTRTGRTLLRMARFEEAQAAHRRVIELLPTSPIGWINLGNTFRAQSRVDDAMNAYQQAMKLDDKVASVHSNLAIVLKDCGKAEQAVISLRRALELGGSSPLVHSNLVYVGLLCPGRSAADLLADARGWAEQHEAPLMSSHRRHDVDPNPDRKLRIGYVSADLRNHVVGRNVLPIFEHHDRNRFEIHAFSVVNNPDEMTQQFKRSCEHWHECSALSDAALADFIRVQRIDILVDLSLHTRGNRLVAFARKPAPVQVTWAGYPGTTGLGSIDYRITDPHLDPPAENDADYSEQSIRLPHSFWCFRPYEGSPDVNDLPAFSAGRVTFGCLNSFSKVNAATIELWQQVLVSVPGSEMRILCPDGSPREEVRSLMERLGISGKRISFVDRSGIAGYLREYNHIDICLDPIPYTGHSTTLDALWMGVPVVTLRGSTSVSRGSVTGLSNTGLTDFISRSPREYVAIAGRFASHLPALAKIRMQLRDRMRRSPLCDEAGFTADLEKAYREMWRRRGSFFRLNWAKS